MRTICGTILAAAVALGVGALGADFSIQREIDRCAAQGGGRVVVPSGRYRTRQLELKSGVELHLEKGAVLEGLPGTENYRRVELPYSEGAWMATVMCIGATNVALTGEGEIYGNGFAWPVYTEHPRDANGKIVLHEGMRPRGVVFADCKNVRVEGVRLLDLPCWGLVFKRCEDVVVRGITVDSFANANSDGVDIEARNFTMTDCEINSGDDSVVFKSNDPNFVMENVFVSNVVGRTHCYNFKLGTASHGTMRNFLITDSRAEGPRRHNIDRRWGREEIWYKGNDAFPGATKESPGVSISSSAIAVECVDGGCVENIVFRNMTLEGACAPIFVRGGYRTSRACGIPPSDKCVLKDILIENVRGWAESTTASSITGTSRCRVDGVTLRNVHIVTKGAGDAAKEAETPVPEHEGRYPNSSMFDNRILPAYGLYIRHADRVRLENTTFTLYPGHTDTRPAVVWDDARPE